MFSPKKLKIAFGIFLVIGAVFAIVQMPLLGGFALGGVITQGILGGFSGKVGPVVGGKWKDIDYMRSYVIPANPNTTGQQTVRAKFGGAVATARKILATVLQPFWDPFYSDMSGFNAFISQNYAHMDSLGNITSSAIMSKGTLEGAAIATAVYTPGTGDVTITWDQTVIGNGLLTDNVLFVAYDTVNKNFYVSAGDAVRDDETASLTAATGGQTSDYFAFLAFYRGTGSELIISDSDEMNTPD